MKKASGFTLVEIAVVLIIIGLLLGGVLKGQELIVQAKIRNAVTDLNGVTAAVYGYQDRYRQVPGDDNTAATRWTNTTNIAPTGATAGNRVIDSVLSGVCLSDKTEENCLFWKQLRNAGLIVGDLQSAASPSNSSGGFLHVQDGVFGASGLKGPVICSTNLSGKIAEAIDNQLDDGKPGSGSVLAGEESSGINTTSLATNYVDAGNKIYTLCKKI
jgi:prepilin-type N-terminal cleavage/methylation domain-containing protein